MQQFATVFTLFFSLTAHAAPSSAHADQNSALQKHAQHDDGLQIKQKSEVRDIEATGKGQSHDGEKNGGNTGMPADNKLENNQPVMKAWWPF